jgi:acyl dehydratase
MEIGHKIESYRVGMTAKFSHTFTQKETEIMADLIADHNPFHYDGEFVKKSRFKEPIVHGLLVGGLISHFGGDLFPGPGCLAEHIEFDFLKPVYFGEKITAKCRITKIEKKDNRLTFEMQCFNEKDEQVVQASARCIPYQIEVASEDEC